MKAILKQLTLPKPQTISSLSSYLRKNESRLSRLCNFCVNTLYWLYKNEFKHSKKTKFKTETVSQKIKPARLVIDDFKEILDKRTATTHFDCNVSIIIPVFKGFMETSNCLFSVLNSECKTSFEVIVINDCSPDPEIKKLLDWLDNNKLIKLINNTSNLGFVKSTNLGLQAAGERNVIFLNSDTQVFGNWVDRILEVWSSNKSIGTITPISNNSTISSYPYFLEENNFQLEVTPVELDSIVSEFPAKSCVSAPTGVGFCMFVSKEARKIVGFLDEKTFGKGYGEEVDFCQKVSSAGFLNVIAPNVYVLHYGSVSFGKDSGKLKKINSVKIAARHSDFQHKLQNFIAIDPLRKFRVKIDTERLYKNKNLKVLHVSHTKGGGTQHFIDSLTSALSKHNIGSLQLAPDTFGSVKVIGINDTFPNLKTFDLTLERELFSDFILNSGIKFIHIHSLIDYPISFLLFLQEFKKKSPDIKFLISLHDYHWICPRINLMPSNDNFCDKIDFCKCEECCKTNSLKELYLSRDFYSIILENADEIFVPAFDMEKRFKKVFPNLKFIFLPHLTEQLPFQYHYSSEIKKQKTLRIGILGGLSAPKGLNVVKGLANYLKTNKIKDMELVLIGYSSSDYELSKLGVKITGKYTDEKQLANLIASNNVNAVFISSICPETFSFTFSEASALGLPIFVFNLGAQAERLKDLKLEQFIIPYEYRKKPKFLYNFMKDVYPSFRPYTFPKLKTSLKDYYGKLFGDNGEAHS